ncbi:Hpt domain-containing protein [Erythrobacter sp. LQ02-29]|uniref:Hpt domain-containing protein n=1 Tax=Erythrobacter sp. LQ02-29 TaxID=2920384 RepID=UPI001F4D40E5|nr:Hpt domain-containing protein [Erythrobacter sp. LQ02-29]MCP9223317.1 Hpt domain-containing protein [Erythrobacter sp. LQ02-29]
MTFEDGAFSATLAAAAGDDPVLRAELRQAFRDSLEHHIDLLRRSRCDANWVTSAQRIRSLAASFCADELMDLAAEAGRAAPGDPVIVTRLEAFLEALGTR